MFPVYVKYWTNAKAVGVGLKLTVGAIEGATLGTIVGFTVGP